MELKDLWGLTRKIRTVSVDTDVIIDILALKLYHSKIPIRLDLNRCEKSFQLLSLLFAVKVRIIGIPVIRKEMSIGDSNLKILYNRVFHKTMRISATMKKLAKAYINKRSIKPADAFIIAAASAGNIDCFFSWNRKDIVNSKTMEVISKINKERNIPTPLLITPEEFLKRFIVSPSLTIAFSREVIPDVFLPLFYSSKQFL